MSSGFSHNKSAPNSPARNTRRAKDSDDEEDDDDDAEESEDDDAKWDNVMEALSIIERDSILSPMEVINILSQNPQLPLSVCYDYSKRMLRTIDGDIESTNSLVENMRAAVHRAEADVEALRQKVILVQIQTMRYITHSRTNTLFLTEEYFL